MSKNNEQKIVKRKDKKNISFGIIMVNATFNNTIVTVSDLSGNVISWCSAGQIGYKGSRKSTPFAAQQVAERAIRAAQEHGLKTVIAKVKGPGAGRESALRALISLGIVVTSIKDVTPIAHNGCRPPKRRRV